MAIEETITLIVVIFLHLAIYSFLFNDNLIYKVVENIYAAVSVGWTLVIAIFFIYTSCYLPMTSAGKWFYIIPFVLGFFVYMQLYPKYSWLFRYPIAIVIGTNTGLQMRGAIKSQFLDQVTSSFLPLTTNDSFKNISNFILIIAVITSVSYFLFNERSIFGPIVYLNKLGRVFLLVSFGAAFGLTVAYRQNLLVARMSVLLAPEAQIYTAAIVIILAIAIILLKIMKKTPE